MGLSQGMGLRRDKPIPLYLSAREKADLKRRSKVAGLSMVEFVRCKTFDIPFHHVGGRSPRGRPRNAVREAAAVPE